MDSVILVLSFSLEKFEFGDELFALQFSLVFQYKSKVLFWWRTWFAFPLTNGTCLSLTEGCSSCWHQCNRRAKSSCKTKQKQQCQQSIVEKKSAKATSTKTRMQETNYTTQSTRLTCLKTCLMISGSTQWALSMARQFESWNQNTLAIHQMGTWQKKNRQIKVFSSCRNFR